MTWRGPEYRKVNQQAGADNRKEHGKVGQSGNIKELVFL